MVTSGKSSFVGASFNNSSTDVLKKSAIVYKVDLCGVDPFAHFVTIDLLNPIASAAAEGDSPRLRQRET